MSLSGRFIQSKVKPKITVQVDHGDKILRYGKTNVYPQYVDDKIDRSPMASSCTEAFANFLMGDGFVSDAVNDQVVNREGDTMRDVLENITSDYSRFYGFALRFEFNLLLEITQIFHVPFEYCRFGHPDRQGYVAQVAVYDNWEEDGAKKPSAERNIQYLHKFNPRPEVIMAQIESAGGIKHYKGQILYWTPQKNKYPKAPLDAVMDDVDTDARVSISKNSNTYNNFMASGFIRNPQRYERDEDGVNQQEEEWIKQLQDFQGAENTGKLMNIDVSSLPPDVLRDFRIFEPMQVQNLDKLFEFTESSCQNAIRRKLLVPKPLLSEFDGNSLSQSAEILKKSVEVYNMLIEFHRNKIEAGLKKVAELTPFLKGKDLTIEEKYAKQLRQNASQARRLPGQGGDPDAAQRPEAGPEDQGGSEVRPDAGDQSQVA